jgi:Tol biopolymer transport system component
MIVERPIYRRTNQFMKLTFVQFKIFINMFLRPAIKKMIGCVLLFSFIKNINAQNSDSLIYPDEKHFKNIQQLTFNGDNAEAYWSYDDRQVIFQRKNEKEGVMCDRMFIGNIPKKNASFQFKQLSSGLGRTTCGYFLPDGKHSDLCIDIPGWR